MLYKLQVTNPPSTPPRGTNIWELKLFRGSEQSPSNRGSTSGYDIRSMEAVYSGNNRLGGSSSSFMTFTPNQNMAKGGTLRTLLPVGDDQKPHAHRQR